MWTHHLHGAASGYLKTAVPSASAISPGGLRRLRPFQRRHPGPAGRGVTLMITVDCGITGNEEIDFAKAARRWAGGELSGSRRRHFQPTADMTLEQVDHLAQLDLMVPGIPARCSPCWGHGGQRSGRGPGQAPETAAQQGVPAGLTPFFFSHAGGRRSVGARLPGGCSLLFAGQHLPGHHHSAIAAGGPASSLTPSRHEAESLTCCTA